MATGGTNVSGRRKGTMTFTRFIDGASMAAAGATKAYLVGGDDDVGYTFDTPVRVTRLSWQLSTTIADAGATCTITVAKGTEATTVYTSGAVDVASAGSAAGTDTTAASNALSNFSTSEDIIVVCVFASLATLECDICVQVDYEYAD